MGAKTTEKLKKSNNCRVCKRTFQTVSALKSHFKFIHVLSNNKQALKKQGSIKKTARAVEQKTAPKNEEGNEKESVLPPKSKQSKTIVFNCPKCSKKFPMYFSAQKHIQKYHCVDVNGVEVLPNSPRLIKPVRVENCSSCKGPVIANKAHNCTATEDLGKKNAQFKCLGCGEWFERMRLYEAHVKESHGSNMEKLCFNSQEECSVWKKQLETNTGTNFLILNRTKSLKTFRCAHQQSIGHGKVEMCPSLLILKGDDSEIEVLYYKEHHGHIYKNLLSDVNDKILKTVKASVGTHSESFIHFRRLMSRVVNEAPSVNSETLDQLISKAVEMTAILKSYEETKDSNTVNKNMSDDQISEALEEKDGVKKRKIDTLTQNNKRIKTDGPTIQKTDENEKVLTSDLLKSKNTQEDPLESEPDREQDKVENPLSPNRSLQSPPSFNDSYKIFVDQNFGAGSNENASVPKKMNVGAQRKKKVVLRTKLGQFNPNLSPKYNSPTKEDDSPKSVARKSTSPLPWKPKVPKKDIVYEVKEQEDDCNILILKI